ncbi:MAG: hypothetical protein QOI87_2137 [Bradyrhizobium sp.]|jgi:hypothetical protein|nr:hypothetical protein [Bradyrhizobium sp.]
MGRPLRKLHQTHFCISNRLDICDIDIWDTGVCNIGIRNIRTTTQFRIRLFPKHMEAQGFVSKNDRLEKADCQTITLGDGRGR